MQKKHKFVICHKFILIDINKFSVVYGPFMPQFISHVKFFDASFRNRLKNKYSNNVTAISCRGTDPSLSVQTTPSVFVCSHPSYCSTFSPPAAQGYRKYKVGVKCHDCFYRVLSRFLFLLLYTTDLVNVTKRG